MLDDTQDAEQGKYTGYCGKYHVSYMIGHLHIGYKDSAN